MIDSHCHLADEVFRADLTAVVDRARAAGLDRALVILSAGDSAEESQAARLLELWDRVRFAVGVHPHMAHEYQRDPDRAVAVVRAQCARMPAVRAIGEIGLDYHYDFSPRDVQRDVFSAQVHLARELHLPIVIHTRQADDDTIAILRESGQGQVRGVLHCFTGDSALAQSGLDLGLFVSVAGIVTFPKAGGLRDVIRGVPLDRLLVETDSPFLAPVPHRGKRNEPAHVPRVAATLASVHAVTVEEIDRLTTRNFEALFGAG
ncbi:MAG: TatD family deoxyribonuclease [Acidimicrobiia bacterium]|nr:TatD family deoxyribonuclease [Acidimicrobiia bacterium]